MVDNVTDRKLTIPAGAQVILNGGTPSPVIPGIKQTLRPTTSAPTTARPDDVVLQLSTVGKHYHLMNRAKSSYKKTPPNHSNEKKLSHSTLNRRRNAIKSENVPPLPFKRTQEKKTTTTEIVMVGSSILLV